MVLRSSISLKLALLVFFGAGTIFAVALAYSYILSKKTILNEMRLNALNTAASVSRKLAQEFRAAEKIPVSIANSIRAIKPKEQQLLDFLKAQVVTNKEIFGSAIGFEPFAFDVSKKRFAPYFFKGKEGITFLGLENASTDYRTEDWYYLPKLLQKPVWTEPYYDDGGGGVLMTTYSVPVFQDDMSGSMILQAVVSADICLEELSKAVCDVKIGEKGFCFLISTTGAFLAHYRPEWITRESIFSIAEELNDPHLRQVGRRMLREPSGIADIGSKFCGMDSYMAFWKISSTQWSLGVVFPKEEVLADLVKLHTETLLIGAGGLFLLTAVSVLIAGSIGRPLKKMALTADKVAEGDLNVELMDVKRKDEVGTLAAAFNHMVEGLRDRDFIRDTFGRYLTREVVNRLLEDKDGLRLGGESREISMIMSDLRGFTALTTSMKPEEVISFLNRYLGKMVEILMDYRGTIDEIIGDGILAFFGAPEHLDDHPARAVACALRMQAEMEEINRLNQIDGFPILEMGVAVNTGRVVVGNIGSERRAKYGAVGSQVNFTGRMESFTVGGQVLISESTYKYIGDQLDIKNILKVQMKGMPGEISLYDVIGIRGTHEIRISSHDQELRVLKNPPEVTFQRIDQKTMKDERKTGKLISVSLSGGVLSTSEILQQWEDIKIYFKADPHQEEPAEIYGKVVVVVQREDGSEATLRFTSVSPEAYKHFPELV